MKTKLKCIMLIDDDEDDNYIHQMVIEEMNITEHVEVAFDGLEALDYFKKAKQTPPDLVFLDINMPKMNGWEFLEEHNKLNEDQKANVIVIMLTTSTNPEDKKRAGQYADATAFKSKPLTKEMLTEVLERYFPKVLYTE